MREILARMFEVKKISEFGEFEGYASIFGNVDAYEDIVEPGAFKKTIAKWAQEKTLPPLVWMHDWGSPIGEIKTWGEDKTGLHVEGKVWIDEPAVEKAVMAYRGMRAGNVRGMSFAFETKQYKYDDDGIRHLLELDVGEITIAPRPIVANSLARVTAVKTALDNGTMPTEREFERLLRDAGFSRRQAQAITADGYRAAQRDAGGADQRDAEVLEAARRLSAKLRAR